MKTVSLSLVILSSTACLLFATPQIGDVLKMPDGTVKQVYGLQFPEKRLKAIEQWKSMNNSAGVTSTANWKGYQVSMMVSDNVLYLTDLTVKSFTEKKGFHQVSVPLTAIFGKNAPIKLSWFSGQLHEYYGKPLGYTQEADKTRIFTFTNGRLRSIKEISTPRK